MVLPFVIPSRTPVINAAIDQILTIEGHLSIASNSDWIEPLLQLFDGLSALYKAGHCLTITAIHQLC